MHVFTPSQYKLEIPSSTSHCKLIHFKKQTINLPNKDGARSPKKMTVKSSEKSLWLGPAILLLSVCSWRQLLSACKAGFFPQKTATQQQFQWWQLRWVQSAGRNIWVIEVVDQNCLGAFLESAWHVCSIGQCKCSHWEKLFWRWVYMLLLRS